MGKPPKPNNIVEKIFVRDDKTRKVSSLFNPTGSGSRSFLFRGRKSQAAIRRLNTVFDFGTSSVKLLQLLLMPNGDFEVSIMDEQPYLIQDSPNLPDVQRKALKEILTRNKVSGPCILGIPAGEIQTYNFLFPVLAEKELEDAIYWKMRPVRPFDLDLEQVKFSYAKWEEHSAGGETPTQQRVIVICARLETVQSRVDMLKKCGLKVHGIEVAPLSLIQFRRFRSADTQPETILWIDMGADETTVVIDRGGVICYVKKLNITSRKLTQQLAQYCRVDETRAEELKKTHGLSFWSMEKKDAANLSTGRITSKEDEPAAVFYGLISVLENLVIDIEHSFKNFAYQVSQSQNTKFDRVILAGGGSQLKNIELFLRVRLGVPIEKLEPFQNIKIPERVKILKKDEMENPLRFASAVGLSFASLRSKSKKFDLLPSPPKYNTQIILNRVLKEPKTALIAAGALIAVLTLPQFAMIHFFKEKAAAAEQKLKMSRAELTQKQSVQFDFADQETKLTEKKTALEAKLLQLGQSKSNTKPFSQVLASLGAMLDEEIWISKLSFAEKKLSITGMTMETDLISGFIETLKKSDAFKDVTFNYTQKEPSSPVYRFEVVMSVK